MEITETPLHEYIDAGLVLIPPFMEGWNKKEVRQAKGIKTRQEIQEAKDKGIRRFQFIPADIDMLVIDLDNKNGKDGSLIFKEWYPDLFTPVYVDTPCNGRHLYFRVSKAVKQELQSYSKQSGEMKGNIQGGEISSGIEIIYDHHLCTTGGSSKAEGRYTLHGRLDYASDLHTYPELLDDIIKTFKPPPKNTYKHPRTIAGSQRTFDQIAEYLRDKKGKIPAPGNRNNYCFSFACCARNQEHPILDTIGYLQVLLEPIGYTREKIETPVNSAYRGKAGL